MDTPSFRMMSHIAQQVMEEHSIAGSFRARLKWIKQHVRVSVSHAARTVRSHLLHTLICFVRGVFLLLNWMTQALFIYLFSLPISVATSHRDGERHDALVHGTTGDSCLICYLLSSSLLSLSCSGCVSSVSQEVCI